MRGQLLFEKARQDGVIQLDGQNGVAYHAGHLIAFLENLVWILHQRRYGEPAMITYVPLSGASYAKTRADSSADFHMEKRGDDRLAGSVPSWTRFSDFVENFAGASSHAPPNPAQSPAQNPEKGNTSEDTSFGVSDLIDMINPLQHIPIVSQIYRSLTGDTIGAVAEIVGGALFGGPVGAVASAGMVAYKHAIDRPGHPLPETTSFSTPSPPPPSSPAPFSSAPATEPVLLAKLSRDLGTYNT